MTKLQTIGLPAELFRAYSHAKDVKAIREGYEDAGMPAWDDLADTEQYVWHDVADALVRYMRGE